MYEVDLLATKEQVMSMEVAVNWMTPIIHFLMNGTLPDNLEEARTLQQRAAHYVYIQERLFKK